mmetsp:Transcript_3513/g.8307  ORF Transcript_3513/g.8307 Transcript_3513/m.8307 type:complete len:483 (+) Transcript_3513:2168-3616(+)
MLFTLIPLLSLPLFHGSVLVFVFVLTERGSSVLIFTPPAFDPLHGAATRVRGRGDIALSRQCATRPQRWQCRNSVVFCRAGVSVDLDVCAVGSCNPSRRAPSGIHAGERVEFLVSQPIYDPPLLPTTSKTGRTTLQTPGVHASNDRADISVFSIVVLDPVSWSSSWLPLLVVSILNTRENYRDAVPLVDSVLRRPAHRALPSDDQRHRPAGRKVLPAARLDVGHEPPRLRHVVAALSLPLFGAFRGRLGDRPALLLQFFCQELLIPLVESLVEAEAGAAVVMAEHHARDLVRQTLLLLELLGIYRPLAACVGLLLQFHPHPRIGRRLPVGRVWDPQLVPLACFRVLHLERVPASAEPGVGRAAVVFKVVGQVLLPCHRADLGPDPEPLELGQDHKPLLHHQVLPSLPHVHRSAQKPDCRTFAEALQRWVGLALRNAKQEIVTVRDQLALQVVMLLEGRRPRAFSSVVILQPLHLDLYSHLAE